MWQKKIMSLHVPNGTPCGRPKLGWSEIIKKNLKDLCLNSKLTADRATWCNAIRLT